MTKARAEAVAAGECVVLTKERLRLKVRIPWRDGRPDAPPLPPEPGLSVEDAPEPEGEPPPERPWRLECLQCQQV
eukprot:11282301-Alexandrium_andersonii.AAC.1